MPQNGDYPESVLVVLVPLGAAARVRVGVWPSRCSCGAPLRPVCEFPERVQAGCQFGAQLEWIEPVILP